MKHWPALLLLLLLSGCLGQGSSPQSGDVKHSTPAKISQSDLAEMIEKGGDFLLIDVRTEGEYKQGHLPGAIVIPYDEFDTRYTEILDYKDRTVVLYCHVGGMGDYAGEVLLKHGFKDVRNLEGGIDGWINHGGRIV